MMINRINRGRIFLCFKYFERSIDFGVGNTSERFITITYHQILLSTGTAGLLPQGYHVIQGLVYVHLTGTSTMNNWIYICMDMVF